MKTPRLYLNGKLRILISTIASLYIIFHGRSLDIAGALRSPSFYLAFTVSFVVALLIISWVQYISIQLDKHCCWLESKATRIKKQVIFGLLIPLLINFALLSIYFYFTGTNIFDNGFMRHDFPLIVCFIMILNFYYPIHYLFTVDTKEIKLATSKDNGDKNSIEPFMIEDDKENIVKKKKWLPEIFPELDSAMIIEDYALFFYADEKYVYMVNQHGEETVVNSSLSKLEDMLSEDDFFRINRSFVVNSKILFDYADGEKRDTLSLYFRSKYEPIIQRYGEDRFAVTKNYIPSITKYFDEY